MIERVNKMATCHHCGSGYSDKDSYCHYCGEPKPQPVNTNMGYEAYKKEVTDKTVKYILFCLFISSFTMLLHTALFIAINALVIPALIIQAHSELRDSKKRLIMEQYCLDQTSICPQCGSHNIKVYRNGYNYTTGYWLRKHGGAYVAGMDSNKARCRCLNCGKDWLTDYDYRLL